MPRGSAVNLTNFEGVRRVHAAAIQDGVYGALEELREEERWRLGAHTACTLLTIISCFSMENLKFKKLKTVANFHR